MFTVSYIFGNIFLVFILALFLLIISCIITAVPIFISFVVIPGMLILHAFDEDSDANAKPCPRCKTLIQRSYGCNHMTCDICKHEFCYVCMANWKRCGAQYNHLINKFVFYTFLDGWKFWSSDCIGNRGYRTLPQRQKGIIQLALLVLLPILLPCSVILVLPASCAFVLQYSCEKSTFFKYTVKDS